MLTRASSRLLATILTAGCLWVLPGAASATIYYDFSGTCETDCARFGLDDGTPFYAPMALGLADGTDTSFGARDVVVETFELFGLDFAPLAAAEVAFDENMVVGLFFTNSENPSADGNLFCYNVAGISCKDGRFDTILGMGATMPAEGLMGHGPGMFLKHVAAAVPEPITPLLLGIGLLTMGAGGGRRREDV